MRVKGFTMDFNYGGRRMDIKEEIFLISYLSMSFLKRGWFVGFLFSPKPILSYAYLEVATQMCSVKSSEYISKILETYLWSSLYRKVTSCFGNGFM